jgi:hypothetical protein
MNAAEQRKYRKALRKALLDYVQVLCGGLGFDETGRHLQLESLASPAWSDLVDDVANAVDPALRAPYCRVTDDELMGILDDAHEELLEQLRAYVVHETDQDADDVVRETLEGLLDEKFAVRLERQRARTRKLLRLQWKNIKRVLRDYNRAMPAKE